jgi:hypothetical protein
VISLDPSRFFLEPTLAELAGPHAPDLLSGHESRLLQHTDVLLHAREGHPEVRGKVCDGSVRARESLEHTAAGDVRKRGKRGVVVVLGILNHVVQYKHTDERCARKV